ncbi:hypothetical protein BGX34_002066, partial [Mortierella sp. NVP85]
MTYSAATTSQTPSWTDCFATDDGRIVVVGGSSQVLVYTIGTSSWSNSPPSGAIKFGPSVPSGMFLNPVYIQSRILADGYTALVVCTLTWNSQPQPYYLDTNTWTVTLAIGTSLTTPPASSASSSGWGTISGGSPMPPTGFRHYTLAVLGQDKSKSDDHYGNGRALIIGGYSTLVTGQVQDWDTVTSFPVQQAPSNVVVMFGNSGALSKATRGSVAYSTSSTQLDIFPGNGGASGNQQRIEVFDEGRNAASVVNGVADGPRNMIFRGATVIGQGAQIFVHGGLTSLDFDFSQPALLANHLVQAVGVWNGDSRQWGDTLNMYVPKKSKGLMIGLIVGGIVVLALIGAGIWYLRKRKRMRLLEEEDRQAKGMVLKNEEKLQNEHKVSHYNGGSPGNYHTAAYYPESGGYSPFRQSGDVSATGRNSSHSHHPYSESGLVNGSGTPGQEKRRTVHAPQEYPSSEISSQPQSGTPLHYQPVVTVPGYPVYGMASGNIGKQSVGEDIELESETPEPKPADPKYSSSVSFATQGATQPSPFMSSPTFTATYSVPDSVH